MILSSTARSFYGERYLASASPHSARSPADQRGPLKFSWQFFLRFSIPPAQSAPSSASPPRPHLRKITNRTTQVLGSDFACPTLSKHQSCPFRSFLSCFFCGCLLVLTARSSTAVPAILLPGTTLNLSHPSKRPPPTSTRPDRIPPPLHTSKRAPIYTGNLVRHPIVTVNCRSSA